MFKLFPFRKHPPAATSSPDSGKSAQDKTPHYPFTEEGIRARAQQVYERRKASGLEGTPEGDWQQAIKELKWERSRLHSWWRWSGIPDKKGWDLVQLLTSVSIPVVIFAGGSWFTYWNNQQQQKIAEDRRKQDIQLADDKAKQDTLVKYLDQMADSLKGGLLKTQPGDDKFIIAQSRTVLALQSLDKKRQQLVIQFLQASRLNYVSNDKDTEEFLIENRTRWHPTKPPSNVKLGLLYRAQMVKANLANSDLSGVALIRSKLEGAHLGCNPPDSKEDEQCSDLSFVDLRVANLEGANITGASLNYANLKGADFWDANLKDADLRGANLSGAILLHTDLTGAEDLTPEQLTGKGSPLLCNVRFPDYIKGIAPYRDCDRIPQALMKRYPKDFPDLQSVKDIVNGARQAKFE